MTLARAVGARAKPCTTPVLTVMTVLVVSVSERVNVRRSGQWPLLDSPRLSSADSTLSSTQSSCICPSASRLPLLRLMPHPHLAHVRRHPSIQACYAPRTSSWLDRLRKPTPQLPRHARTVGYKLAGHVHERTATPVSTAPAWARSSAGARYRTRRVRHRTSRPRSCRQPIRAAQCSRCRAARASPAMTGERGSPGRAWDAGPHARTVGGGRGARPGGKWP